MDFGSRSHRKAIPDHLAIMFLGLSMIRGFWNRDFVIIRKVTDIPVPQLPHIALLNEKVTDGSCAIERLIHFILLAANLAIDRSWKCPSVHIALFRRNVSWIMLNEHLASSFTDCAFSFRKYGIPGLNMLI